MQKEFIQAVDSQNQPLNYKVDRKTAHTDGVWHRTINFLLIDRLNRKVFFQSKKDLNLENPEGFFLNINGGHMVEGQDLEASFRELREELGISPEDIKSYFIGKYQISVKFSEDFLNNEFMYFYIVDVKDVKSKIVIDKQEVKGVISFDPDEALDLLDGKVVNVIGHYFDGTKENSLALTKDMFRNFTDDQLYKKLLLIASNYLNDVSPDRLVI